MDRDGAAARGGRFVILAGVLIIIEQVFYCQIDDSPTLRIRLVDPRCNPCYTQFQLEGDLGMKTARVVFLLMLLTSCDFPALGSERVATEPPSATQPPLVSPDTVGSPSSEPASALATSTVASTLDLGEGPGVPERPEEAILILEPGNGSRLTSPIHVAGIADPTFEQTLVVRVVFDDGSELAVQPVTIAADIGRRGPFAGDIPFIVSGERHAFIQVYDQSARDGGVIHLASVGVILTDTGPAEIAPAEPHPEQIAIFRPVNGEVIEGGLVRVEGFGLAGFEQTLLIEVYDADGSLVGSQPIIVKAPDLGLPGPFSADILYAVAVTGPGRIVVRDVSPAFGGDSHLASVEVMLEP
jgi:hypothetical protein